MFEESSPKTLHTQNLKLVCLQWVYSGSTKEVSEYRVRTSVVERQKPVNRAINDGP